MEQCGLIDSIDAFIKETRDDFEKWGLGKRPWFPWFRGEPHVDTPLVPKLYRTYHKKLFDDDYQENRILQNFRAKAMAYGETPQREQIDLWMFLAQHVGLPTRLLDWTGSSLVALYFALQEEKPVVWMLDPFGLNNVAQQIEPRPLRYNIYALTWYPGSREKPNIGHVNIQAAWMQGQGAIELPVAISPTYVHPRIPAQKSYFTVHGKEPKSLNELVGDKDILKKYVIEKEKKQKMLDELNVLGISRAALFPDLEGLSKDLTELFRPDLASWIKRS